MSHKHPDLVKAAMKDMLAEEASTSKTSGKSKGKGKEQATAVTVPGDKKFELAQHKRAAARAYDALDKKAKKQLDADVKLWNDIGAPAEIKSA